MLPSMLLHRPLPIAGGPRLPPPSPAAAAAAAGPSQASLAWVPAGLCNASAAAPAGPPAAGSGGSGVPRPKGASKAAAAAAPALGVWSFRRSSRPCCSDRRSRLSLRSCCTCCSRPENSAPAVSEGRAVAQRSRAAACWSKPAAAGAAAGRENRPVPPTDSECCAACCVAAGGSRPGAAEPSGSAGTSGIGAVAGCTCASSRRCFCSRAKCSLASFSRSCRVES